MNDTLHNEIKFFGKITASITHEIQNVFSIMQESKGLLEDFLMVMDFPDKEKLSKPMDRIHRQINRGVDIVKTLNRFAHSPDHCPASIDLNDIAYQMVLLSGRLSKLRNIELTSIRFDHPLPIQCDPVLLQMAIFNAIEILFGVLEPGNKIVLCPQKIQNQYTISIQCDHSEKTGEAFESQILSSDNWDSLNHTMKDLNGNVTLHENKIDIIIRTLNL